MNNPTTNTCPICGAAERARDARDIVFECGNYIAADGKSVRLSARCPHTGEVISALRAQLAEAEARGDTYRRRALVLVRRAATERSWYKFALVVADAQDAELAAAEAERDQARAALAEAETWATAARISLKEVVGAMMDYEMDVDGPAPQKHNEMMRRACALYYGVEVAQPPAPAMPPGGEE